MSDQPAQQPEQPEHRVRIEGEPSGRNVTFTLDMRQRHGAGFIGMRQDVIELPIEAITVERERAADGRVARMRVVIDLGKQFAPPVVHSGRKR